MSVSSKLKYWLFPDREREPGAAYDLWAAGYDDQPGNLMLDLDEQVFTNLFSRISAEGKRVADIGCGTGRHWPGILKRQPQQLTGFDVSEGMLQRLNAKFPGAPTSLIKDEKLPGLSDHSCDIIVSTLAVAHIEDMESALIEWNRVLRAGGDIIITDYHPMALSKGGKRTFSHKGKTVAVKNFIHPIETLRRIAGQLGWEEIRFMQRIIDDTVKTYYEKQNALHLFESFRNVPIIYGIHLKKKDGPA
ncbi:MAG: class I SAM-dependent methyltransferase [Bacteroidetes bacterium]|nr:class I SAM-dependent methyltransferase [Bacteroidota bacterium]